MASQKPKSQAFFDHHSKTNWWNEQHPFWALYLFNKIRVPFICRHIERYMNKRINQCRILDIGCGAGFLSEALCMKGAQVVGIDTSRVSIQVATKHRQKQLDRFKKENNVLYRCFEDLEYRTGQPQDLCRSIPTFDLVIASEVIEHVDQPKDFLVFCSKLLNPGGVLVITTPNRTFLSYLLIIIFAEYVLKLLPKNTHEYSKFLKPKEVKKICQDDCSLEFLECSGAFYLPWPFNTWLAEPLGLVNFIISFRKKK